jgi:hypothetical protein
MCSVCRNHNPVLSSFMSYHRVYNKSNTAGSTCEQELKTLPEHLNSLPVFRGVHVAQSFVFCVMFCRLLFILLSFFVILLSVLLYCDFWLTLLHFQTFLSIGICCGLFVFNDWIKRKKYHTVRTVLKYNRQIVERGVKGGGLKNRMIIILQCITWLWLMCPSVATCLSVDCCFSELSL